MRTKLYTFSDTMSRKAFLSVLILIKQESGLSETRSTMNITRWRLIMPRPFTVFLSFTREIYELLLDEAVTAVTMKSTTYWYDSQHNPVTSN
jgi:hypothetical protein